MIPHSHRSIEEKNNESAYCLEIHIQLNFFFLIGVMAHNFPKSEGKGK